MKEFKIIYEIRPQAWFARCPDLPNCIAQGANRAEVEARIQEMLSLYQEKPVCNQ